MDVTIRWGIAATGRIATSFARDLREVAGADLVAVASRSTDRAGAFAEAWGAEGCRTYSTVAELADDPGVDVVYVASPHALHHEQVLLTVAAGKAVLCEKPLAMNATQGGQLVDAATQARVFLMEGMWMVFNPVIRAVRGQLGAGRFGVPRQVHADLGFVVEADPGSRLVDASLGAGALLDMGIDPLTLADVMLGPAEELAATASLADDGYDLDIAIAGRYAGGAVAALTASMTSVSPRTATIATDAGTIELPAPFHHPSRAVWHPVGGEPETILGEEPLLGSGLGNEAAEVVRCVRDGLLESPTMPHEQSLRLLRQMDAVREQVGVRYPVDL